MPSVITKDTETMHVHQQTTHPAYLHGTLDALRAQLQQITKTIDTLEKGLPTQPKDLVPTPNLELVPPSPTGYELLGQAFPARNLTEAFVAIFRHFAELDPTFPARFKQALLAEATQAKKPSKRGFLAPTPEALYPGKPALWKYAKEITPGWLLGTNESSAKKRELLKLACKVIGLRWNEALKLSLHQ